MEKAHRPEQDLATPEHDAQARPAARDVAADDASAPQEARMWSNLDDARGEAASVAIENKGGGQPVDPNLAAEVGGQYGVDLRHTRVHKDPTSRGATRAMRARAFAHGDDIYLGPGESETDRALMAHELAHVAQQRGGRPRTQMKVAVGAANSPAEQEADAVAAQVVGGATEKQLVIDGGVPADGQLTKAVFQAQLKQAIVQVTEQELGKIGATLGCPYIDRYFAKYAALPASSTEMLIRHWIPATKNARSAQDLIPPVLVRVREAVKSWSTTRRLPPDLAMLDPEVSTDAATAPKAQAQTLGGLEAELGEGQKLDGATAARMSRVVGDDVSGARIHTGSVAHAKAAEHGALAFATGTNVVMGAGAPAPGTATGDALLAHELAHVAQQKDAAADPAAREQPIGAEEARAEQAADARLAALGNFAGAIGDVMRTNVQLQRCASWEQADDLQERLGLTIDVSPAPPDGKAMIVGQSLKLSLGQKNPSTHKAVVYHWEAIDPRGNKYLHAPGETMSVQLIWPGTTTLKAKIGTPGGDVIEYAFIERQIEAVRADTRATELVNTADAPAAYTTFRASQDVNLAILSPDNKPSADQPLSINGGANPAKLNDGTLSFGMAYKPGETVPSGRTYHWYAYPLAAKDAPAQLGKATKTSVEGKDAYDLGSGQSAQLATTHKGVYVVAVHGFDGSHKAVEATYVQTVLDGKEIDAVGDLKKQLAAVDQHMGEFATTPKGDPDVAPITAFHVDASTGTETQLNMFIGKRKDGSLAMVNATPGLKITEHRLVFTGSSTNAVLDDFDSNNKYPTGIVRFKVPGGKVAGVDAAERSIQTTGDTFLGHLASALAVGGLVLSIAAIPFTGGGSMAATALFIGAAGVGVAAGAFSLADHLSNEDFTTGQVALDCLQIAASFIDLGLAVKALKTSPALMVANRSARYALWSSLAIQGASAVLISVEAIDQITKIVEDDTLSRGDKISALTKIIATLVVTGGLLVLSYKSLGEAKQRMTTHFGDKGKALKDLDAAALGLVDDNILKTLKAASKEELERLAAMIRQDPALVTRLPGRKNVYGALKGCKTNEAAELERRLFSQRLAENGHKGNNVERVAAAIDRAGIDPAAAHLLTDEDLKRLKKADDALAGARSKRDADPEKATAIANAKAELDGITGVASGTRHDLRAALAHVNGMPDPGYVVDPIATIKSKFPKLKQPELDVLAKLDKDALIALENATESDLKKLIKRMQDGASKDASEILRSYYYKSKKAVRGEKDADAGKNVYEPPKNVGDRIDTSLDNLALARGRGYPFGFADKAQYDAYMSKLKSALTARKIPTGDVHVHGSAVHNQAPGDVDVAVIVDDATFNALGARFKQSVQNDPKAIAALSADLKKGKISSSSFYPDTSPTVAQEMAGSAGKLDTQVSVVRAGSEFDLGPYLDK